MHVVIQLIAPLRQAGARLGPYVLLELLLPGGTLFALLLLVHQHVKASGGGHAIPTASPPVLVSAACAVVRTNQAPTTPCAAGRPAAVPELVADCRVQPGQAAGA
jgi:hypothetical protein